jgi:hypothetical protein
MTKQDILSYLNSVRKPTSIDPQQKWIGSYNNRLRYYAKFFRWLYNKEEPDYQKRISPMSILLSHFKQLTDCREQVEQIGASRKVIVVRKRKRMGRLTALPSIGAVMIPTP